MLRRLKSPAQMRPTLSAHRHPPPMARKPGEFIGVRADVTAARGVPETTNVKSDLVRVGKRMLMCAQHANPLIVRGDGIPARNAHQTRRPGSLRFVHIPGDGGWCELVMSSEHVGSPNVVSICVFPRIPNHGAGVKRPVAAPANELVLGGHGSGVCTGASRRTMGLKVEV